MELEKRRYLPVLKNWFLILSVLFFSLVILISCGDRVKLSDNTGNQKVFGLNFGPYIDGQSPNLNSIISNVQLRERMEIIKDRTTWIRTFGTSNGLENAGKIAHETGLKVAVGAWLDSNLTTNEVQIENLIKIGLAGEANLLIVGSEVLFRGDLTKIKLIEYINRVKKDVPSIPVTTADVYTKLLENKEVIDAVDVVMANHYPYWDGLPIEKSIASIHASHIRITEAAKGKKVFVSETGWPSGGRSIGKSVSSPENASFHFLNFVSWANVNNVPYFYFEAFDEKWKEQDEGTQGSHWGIFSSEGKIKPGMQAVFDGKIIEDNWSHFERIPGGPGDPVIKFTSIPPLGSFQDLEGQILHVDPFEHKIVVYVMVAGRWWVKPLSNKAKTSISFEGSYVVDITTGGIDPEASTIAAFLIPNSYAPPILLGSSSLPSELDVNSVAKAVASR